MHHPVMNFLPTARTVSLLKLGFSLALVNAFAASAEVAPLSLDQALKNFATAPVSAPAKSDALESGGELRAGGIALGAASAAFTEWRSTQSQLSNLQSYFDNNDYANALRQARQYARQATTPEIRQRWTDLIAALEAEQKNVEAVVIAKIDAAIKRAGAAALAAKQPADLDTSFEELSTLSENRNHNSTRTQRAYNRLSNATSFLQQWQNMLSNLAENDHEAVRQELRNLKSNNYRDRPISRAQILAYAAALKLEGMDLAATMARLDPIIARNAALALVAKKASELDPLLDELEVLKDEFAYSSDSPLRLARKRVEDAVSFFREWQDFLAAYEAGDLRDSRQELRSLAGNNYTYRPISRSQILARATSLRGELATESDALLATVTWKNLSDVRDRLALLQEQSYGRESTELARYVSELDRLHGARLALDRKQAGLGRAALLAGASTSGGCGSSGLAPGDLPTAISTLREAWWFEAMPALTGLADLPGRQGTEAAADYANRQLDAALGASDWARAYRLALLARDTRAMVAAPCAEREKTTGTNPADALGSWLLGQKLEKARQLHAAAAAYRRALAAGSPPALETVLLERLGQLPDAPQS